MKGPTVTASSHGPSGPVVVAVVRASAWVSGCRAVVGHDNVVASS